MMRYVFHPEALAEYAEAAQYYSAQNTSIAQDFVNAIEAAIDKIQSVLASLMMTSGDV